MNLISVYIKKYLYLIIFMLISVLSVYSFKYGYYFFLDYVPTTNGFLNIDFYNNGTVYFIINFFNHTIGEIITQKLIFLLSLFFLGLGGYSLVKDKNIYSAYFVGIFMMINPFIYSRMMDGQFNVFMGTAFMIWGIVYLVKFFRTNLIKYIFISSVIFGLGTSLLNHSLFFVGAAGLIFILLVGGNIFRKLLHLSIFFGIYIILNLNWLIGGIVGTSYTGKLTQSLGQQQFNTFLTDPGSTGIYYNVLSLHGYWGEREGRFKPSYLTNDKWYLLFGLIFLIILFGIYSRLSDKNNTEKNIDYSFITIGVISYILALGISGNNIFAPVSQFLYDYIPFYKGLREPQKWVGMLLIVYAWFGAFGVQRIYELARSRDFYPQFIGAALIALPVFYTPAMLFGFAGQLKVSDYPAQRYSIKLKIENGELKINSLNDKNFENSCESVKAGVSQKCYDILVFPWHQYIGLGFTQKIIANPAEGFFYPAKILQGDNMEIGGIYTQSFRPESKIIEQYIGPAGKLRDTSNNFTGNQIGFIKDLKGLGIQYILMMKESDWNNYIPLMQALIKQNLIEIYEDNERVILYRLK